jgi:hypothetical protein
MGNRRWLWISACLLIAGVIFWGIGQAVGPSGSDTEFRKTLESMKQVKSFRGAFTETASSAGHSERLWEVDCTRVVVHQHSQDSQTNTDSPFEMKEDELLVGEQRYIREGNGSWENTGYAGDRSTAKWYCGRIAEGSPSSLLPDMFTLISHGITENVGKKTVNGVRCREWKFDLRTPISSRQGAICIGVDDHLPYEMTMDGGHYFYSDYNQPIPLEVPEAALQPTSSTGGSN